MGYTYDLVSAKADKRAAIGLSSCHVVDNLVELFLSTFLVAYIYKFSSDIFDYLLKVSVFEMVGWAAMLIVYIFVSRLVDKTNRVGIFRFSMILWAALILFVIIIGDGLENLLWLAGMLQGIVKGFYWSSYNVIKQEMVGRNSMGQFATYTRIFQQVVRVLFPITLGTIIDLASFQIAAIVVFAFIVIQICLSFMIKSKHPQDASFNLKGYIDSLKENTPFSKRMKFIYFMAIIFAANNIMETLINVYIMILYGSNISLGTITSIIAVAVIIETFCIDKWTKSGKRKLLYITSAIIPILSVVLFIVSPIKSTLIVFNVALSLSGGVFKLIFDVYRNKFLKEYGKYDEIAEHQCIIETILQFVRVFVDAAIILVALTKNIAVVQVLIVIFTIFYSLNSVLLLVFEQKFISNENKILKNSNSKR